MKSNAYLAVATVFLLCLVGWTGYSQKSQPPRVSWEYLVTHDLTRHNGEEGMRKINELGSQGWELTGVSDETINDGNQTVTRLYFKRAK